MLHWLLIAVLAWSAGGKFFWPAENRANLAKLGMIPSDVLGSIAAGLPVAEIMLALWLAIGVGRAAARLAAMFVFTSFAGVHALLLAWGSIVPCGCMGISIVFDSWWAHVLIMSGSLLCAAASLALLLFDDVSSTRRRVTPSSAPSPTSPSA